MVIMRSNFQCFSLGFSFFSLQRLSSRSTKIIVWRGQRRVMKEVVALFHGTCVKLKWINKDQEF